LNRFLACAAVLCVAAGCAGQDERPEVTRLTIAAASGVPGAHDPAPVTLTSGRRFREAVELLPRPLPAAIGAPPPGLESQTCFPVRLNVEHTDGTTVSYAECFPRSMLPACVALSSVLPRGTGCARAASGPLVKVEPGVQPRSRVREIEQATLSRLGQNASLEALVAFPTSVRACAFVTGCPPPPADGSPRPVWLVVGYRDIDAVVAPPSYVVVDDADARVLASRTAV
jgi:hypothetical protein